MQSLHQCHPLLLLPLHAFPTNKLTSFTLSVSQPHRRHILTLTGAGGFSPEELPIDENFLENFGPKDQETEDEARRRDWVERGWAPWEEVLSPEGYFARMSLNEGEEVPLRTPEALEAFRLLSPEYRRKKMEESGLEEEEWYMQQFTTKVEVPEPIETKWNGALAFRMMPPRDWPPRGWVVDAKELAFIREAHKLQAVRVDLAGVEQVEVGEGGKELGDMCLERYKVFLKLLTENSLRKSLLSCVRRSSVSPSLTPYCLLSSLFTMSSVEQPLGLDIPNLSSIVHSRQIHADGYRPRLDDMEMGNCLIEGRPCSPSNSCLGCFLNNMYLNNMY